jgi:biopolymer transport protein ExbD
MTIKRVFRQKYKFPNIPVDRFFLGIFLGFFSAVTFYLFFNVSREVLRVMFSESEYYDLWILTDKETWFYNLIFAFISSNLGQGVCFKTWFEGPKRLFSNSYFDFKRKVIYNEAMFFNLNFLNVFAKLAVVYAIWFGEHYCYLIYNISSKYNFVWIILILVMHLEQWKTIRKVYRKNSIKGFIIFTSAIIILSFSLSFLNPVDYKSFNSKYLSKSIDYNYQLDRPISKYGRFGLNRFLDTDLFFVYSKSTLNYDTLPTIILENEVCSINNLPQLIEQRYSYLESEDFMIQIHCDRNMKMKYLKQLKESLAKAGVKRISLAVTPEKHIYPSRVYRYHGLESYLPDYSYFKENHVEQITSAKKGNILQIEILSNNLVSVNDNFVQIENLQVYIKQFYNLNTLKGIQFSTHDNVEYKTYILVRDNLNETINYLKKLKQKELEEFIKTPFNLMELMERQNKQ